MQGGRTFKLWGQTDCFQILQILPFLSDYRESQTSSEYNPVPLQRLYNRGDKIEEETAYVKTFEIQ